MVTPPLTPAERAAELYPKDAAAELNERDIITDAERSAYIRGDAEGYARAIEAAIAVVEHPGREHPGEGAAMRKALYFDPTGPMIRYENGMLLVDDLNPQISTRWRMSRKEMLIFGWRCLIAALKP